MKFFFSVGLLVHAPSLVVTLCRLFGHYVFYFFFNDTATTEIYTLSLHDALPIYLFNNLIQRNQSAAFSSGKVRPNHETNINIIARRTGKDVNSHTVLDGIITTIMATIQRINIIGSREGSRNRRRLK